MPQQLPETQLELGFVRRDVYAIGPWQCTDVEAVKNPSRTDDEIVRNAVTSRTSIHKIAHDLIGITCIELMTGAICKRVGWPLNR